MSTSPGRMILLNWKSLVDEALQRRKAEKMTQKDHAALANVSVPTIAAFDRGETTLSLAKAFDILRIVGLVDESPPESTQDVFVKEAFARWCILSDNLPKNSPGRFPYGWVRFDYCLDGDLKSVALKDFEKLLKKAITHYSGWPPFLILEQPENTFYEIEGMLECWLQHKKEKLLCDAAHNDFWRAKPGVRLFLMRGYQEDCAETFQAGTIFDTTLPIWRMGEVLLHAERLASLLQKDASKPIMVHFRALYSGLGGRVLYDWANPFSNMLRGGGRPARRDEVILEASIPAKNISPRLAEHLYPLLSSLYSLFGVTELSQDSVQAETKSFLEEGPLNWGFVASFEDKY